MADETRGWEDIIREFVREDDPEKRQQLQQDLGAALERDGFQNLTKNEGSSKE